MLAFFNMVAAKIIPVICVLFALGAGQAVRTVSHAVSPVVSIFTQSEKGNDPAASGTETTAAQDTLRPATPKQPPGIEEPEIRKYKDLPKKPAGAKEKSIKISISDKGVKVGSEDGEEVFLHMNTEELAKGLEDALNSEELNLILDSAVDLASDSGSLDLDERHFRVIRSDQLVRFGEDIHIGRHEMVRGDVVAIFGDVTVEGKVTGDVVSILGDIEITAGAIVNGEVVTVLGSLEEDENANVRGQTVVVGGAHNFAGVPFISKLGSGLFNAVARIVSFIVGTLAILLIIYFLPERMRKSSDFVFGSFMKSLGVGVLSIVFGGVVMAIIAVILSITIIGIPVAILIILSYVALIIMGYFASSLALGCVVARRFNIGTDSLFMKGFIGFFLLSVPGLLSAVMFLNPVFFGAALLKGFGVLINIIAAFAGTGAFIVSKAGLHDHRERPKLPE